MVTLKYLSAGTPGIDQRNISVRLAPDQIKSWNIIHTLGYVPNGNLLINFISPTF